MWNVLRDPLVTDKVEFLTSRDFFMQIRIALIICLDLVLKTILK